MLNPYAVEPGVCCHQQCPRLHLCFATACYQTAGRSISRGRIHGIFGFHAASSHINYLQECAAFHLLSTSYQVCSGVTLLREFYTAIRVAPFLKLSSSSLTSMLLIISTNVFMFRSSPALQRRYRPQGRSTKVSRPSSKTRPPLSLVPSCWLSGR